MKLLLIVVGVLFSFNASAEGNPVDTLLGKYQAAGGKDFSAAAGQTLWQQSFTTEGEQRSCGTCHGNDLVAPGKHAKTGKVIDAMAPSVNAKRLTDIKHMEKWLLRNCKWTLGRECDAQEKGDLLTYLRGQ